jgi:hypothetical protein
MQNKHQHVVLYAISSSWSRGPFLRLKTWWHGASEILMLLPSHIMDSTLLPFQTMEAWTLQGCASEIFFFDKRNILILTRYQLHLASAIQCSSGNTNAHS